MEAETSKTAAPQAAGYMVPCPTLNCMTMIEGSFYGDFGSAVCPTCGTVFLIKVYSKPVTHTPIERDDLRMLDNTVRAIDEYTERLQE